MCLAIVAPMGTDKSSKFLVDAIREGSRNNGDGMGFAYKRNSTKKVFLSKGYSSVDKLIEAIYSKKLKEQDELIVHARIGNKGEVNSQMCHPFVCSKDDEEVKMLEGFVDKPVLIHNGTFYKYSIHNSRYSDTFFFARDFMSIKGVQNFLKEDKDSFKKLFEDHIETSRVALLFPDDTSLITLGNFIEEQGYLFSNKGYKEYTRNIGGYEYDTYSTSKSESPWGDDDKVEWNYGRENTRNYSSSERTSVIHLPSKNTVKPQISLLELLEDVKKNSAIIRSNSFVPFINTSHEKHAITKKGVIYRYYMGILFPVDSKYPLEFQPNAFNYYHFNIQSNIEDDSYQIKKGAIYNIVSFDKNLYDNKDTYRFHYVKEIGSENYGVMIDESILQNNIVFPKIQYKKFYEEYLDLIENISISKTKIKYLSKLLKNNFKDKLAIKNAFKPLIVDRKVVEMFLYYAIDEFYSVETPEKRRERFINSVI